MNDETDFEDIESELEIDSAGHGRSFFKEGINLDARRRLEIYLEERALQKQLVGMDFDFT